MKCYTFDCFDIKSVVSIVANDTILSAKEKVFTNSKDTTSSANSITFTGTKNASHIKKIFLNDREMPLDSVKIFPPNIKNAGIKFQNDSIILFLYTK